jgi:hypothetical protein
MRATRTQYPEQKYMAKTTVMLGSMRELVVVVVTLLEPGRMMPTEYKEQD